MRFKKKPDQHVCDQCVRFLQYETDFVSKHPIINLGATKDVQS